jgi:hypothetical protein
MLIVKKSRIVEYPGENLSGEASPRPGMRNSFTNEASPERIIWGISPRLNTGWDGKLFNES